MYQDRRPAAGVHRRRAQGLQDGERSHPSMRGIAPSLNDQDMADLAAYYGAPAK